MTKTRRLLRFVPDNPTTTATYETVSVICVCFNEDPLKIKATLNSIIAQDYIQTEIIIIDGGSKPNTLNAFEEYRRQIKHMISERDNGIFDAMNKGISRATGDWIIFMNIGDKFYDNHSLSGLITHADSDFDIVYGNVVIHDVISRPPQKLSKYALYRHGRGICHQAILARRSLFSRIGSFDLSYKVCGDPEWIIRAFDNGAAFKYADVIVASYERNGFSANYELRQPYWKKMIRQHFSNAEISVYWTISIFERALRRIATLDFTIPRGVKRLYSKLFRSKNKTITSELPEWVKNPLRRLRNIANAIIYYGKERFCPVCGKSSRKFRQYGLVPREDAQCMLCGALERHRFLWLYLLKKTDLFDGTPKKVLHIAPEACFESRFKERLCDNYLTADLFNPRAMVKMDITNIEYDDESFDAIYCSHVLEHVQDDKRAIREFFRVLKNDGWAILVVPINAEKTFEDPSIVDSMERLKLFGHEDHVRRCGRDYVDRIRNAGFSVEVTKVKHLIQSDEAVRMGLTPASGEIYYCTK